MEYTGECKDLQRKADLALLRAFTDYTKRAREFSDEGMNLYQMAEMHAQEVCFIVSSQPVIHLLTQRLKKKPLDLVLIWQCINTQADDEVPAGCNALMKLAIHVLSVVANLAGCEHSFSIFGNIHTKTCNKLGAETVHKTGVLKMDIQRRQIEEGHVPVRKKQQFSTVDQPDCVMTPVSIDPGVSPIDFVQSLINEANDDDNTSAIGSFGFQRFYNLGNLEKARKTLETRLAGNSSPFSRKIISETIYRNLQNL